MYRQFCIQISQKQSQSVLNTVCTLWEKADYDTYLLKLKSKVSIEMQTLNSGGPEDYVQTKGPNLNWANKDRLKSDREKVIKTRACYLRTMNQVLERWDIHYFKSPTQN